MKTSSRFALSMALLVIVLFVGVLPKAGAGERFLPVVVDGGFLGGYQDGKWVKAVDLSFTAKGTKKKNLSYSDLVDVIAAKGGEGMAIEFSELPKGRKFSACVAGEKKAVTTFNSLWLSFLGGISADFGELPKKDDGRIWVSIDGSLEGANARTERRDGPSFRFYVDDGDAAVEFERDPAGDGVGEASDAPYEHYKVTLHYGGQSYGLDGVDLYESSASGEVDCVFIDVNGDGRAELVMSCYSETSGHWVYELNPGGPEKVLEFIYGND